MFLVSAVTVRKKRSIKILAFSRYSDFRVILSLCYFKSRNYNNFTKRWLRNRTYLFRLYKSLFLSDTVYTVFFFKYNLKTVILPFSSFLIPVLSLPFFIKFSISVTFFLLFLLFVLYL